MRHWLAIAAAAIFSAAWCPAGRAAPPPTAATIICSPKASLPEKLAAKEVRRYVYVLTGKMLATAGAVPAAGEVIVVAGKGDPIVAGLADAKTLRALGPQQYLLRTVRHKGRKALLIVGGDPVAVLYGAYWFAEHLGARFYLHGDVVPDEPKAFSIPDLDSKEAPLFRLRGIQPFHDFPEGPDWWNTDDYKAVLAQLPKMRMNFFGLHTYPEGGAGPEPAVWIGTAEDVGPKGKVKFSYPSRHFTTANGTWGYRPAKTGDYAFGAAELFDRDVYGADYMSGAEPWPKTPEARNDVFNRFAQVLGESFTLARALGIRTCIGTEAPLKIPRALRDRLKAAGKNPDDPAVRQAVYEGMFQRIMKTHPLDYYWFWTPEGWTWRDVKKEHLDATLADFRTAIAAAKKVKAPFTLATCGWVLGPQNDRSLFDKVLPKAMPVGCISRNVGFAPVETGFARIEGRPKWSIPWLEDDPGMIIPQLWVGRMRRDAADSLAYGCTGLMGIHWRTRILGPNVSALAKAAWDQSGWNPALGKRPAPRPKRPKARDVPADDFYADWARTQFGPEAAKPLAKLFARLDGGPTVTKGQKANLPRPATWVGGPGGIKPDRRPWSQVQQMYAFVDEMAALRPRIKGPGNRERFDYWLANFRYLKAIGRLNCVWGAKGDARALTDALREVHEHLLATVKTPGEMGTVTNWQQHIIRGIMKVKFELPRRYEGPARLIVPTVRTSLGASEALNLKAIVLAEAKPKSAVVRWRAMGPGPFKTIALKHVARGVWKGTLPAEAVKGADFEYHVKVVTSDGASLHFPAGEPAANQTVVVIPGAIDSPGGSS